MMFPQKRRFEKNVVKSRTIQLMNRRRFECRCRRDEFCLPGLRIFHTRLTHTRVRLFDLSRHTFQEPPINIIETIPEQNIRTFGARQCFVFQPRSIKGRFHTGNTIVIRHPFFDKRAAFADFFKPAAKDFKIDKRLRMQAF